MIREIRKFVLTCDECDTEITYETTHEYDVGYPDNLPDGWVVWKKWTDMLMAYKRLCLCPQCKEAVGNENGWIK